MFFSISASSSLAVGLFSYVVDWAKRAWRTVNHELPRGRVRVASDSGLAAD
jgi:hypothetical protein